MVNESPISARVREFDAMHGGNPVTFQNAYWLYADAAMRDKNMYGALSDPPQDTNTRLKLIVRYWEIKTANAQKEFTDAKDELLQEARALKKAGLAPHEPKERLAALKKLQAEVKATNANLVEARQELERHTPGVAQQAVHRGEIDEAVSQFLTEVESLKV